jgi:hypothetical protein
VEASSHHSAPQAIAYSARGAARAVGIGRAAIAAAIRSGELRASRIGDRSTLTILRVDLERWIGSFALRPTERAEQAVERIIARRDRRAAR